MRLCRLSGKTHAQDYAEFYLSHTPYEWLIQQVANIVEPFGEPRADTRHKVNSMYLKSQDEKDLKQLFDLLTNYPGVDRDDQNEMPANQKALEKIKQQKT